MFKLAYKIIGLIIMIAVLGYVSVCAFASYKGCGLDEPDIPEVRYSVRIEVTGLTIFTDDYEVKASSEAGKQIYTLHGYYEQVDGKYKYKDIDLVLDEKDFGEIEGRVVR